VLKAILAAILLAVLGQTSLYGALDDYWKQNKKSITLQEYKQRKLKRFDEDRHPDLVNCIGGASSFEAVDQCIDDARKQRLQKIQGN
jgi:hypothetical protein